LNFVGRLLFVLISINIKKTSLVSQDEFFIAFLL
jgi:hypothetical protein